MSFIGNYLPLTGGQLSGSLTLAANATYDIGSVSAAIRQTWTEKVFSDTYLDLGANGPNNYWRVLGAGSLVNVGGNTQVFGWSNAGSGTLDTGISRNGAAVFAFGNGTAQDVTGEVQAAVFKTTTALITATGASTPTFGTNFIGGTGGPTVAAQNGWMKLKDSSGATVWMPVWK